MKILNYVLLFAFVSFIYSCSENENLATENKYEINAIDLDNEKLLNAFENNLGDIDYTQINKHLNTSIALSSFDFSSAKLVNENKEGSQSVMVELTQDKATDYELYMTALIDEGQIGSPVLIKIVDEESLSYYDIHNAVALEGTYQNESFQFKKSQYGTPLAGAKCGQAVADCMGDAYGNHGWASVYIIVQTAFLPWTAAGVAGACALINC